MDTALPSEMKGEATMWGPGAWLAAGGVLPDPRGELSAAAELLLSHGYGPISGHNSAGSAETSMTGFGAKSVILSNTASSGFFSCVVSPVKAARLTWKGR